MYDAAREAEGADGRLAVPSYMAWPTSPFEGDLRVKPVEPPRIPEDPRAGEGDRPCGACDPDRPARWTDGTWRLIVPDEPSGMPLLAWLEPVEHLDLVDLDAEAAARLGQLTVTIVQASERQPGIARTHVLRWGDGGSHLHVMFMSRPEGLPQVRGSFAIFWDDILPPFPTEERDAIVSAVGDALVAAFGGEVAGAG